MEVQNLDIDNLTVNIETFNKLLLYLGVVETPYPIQIYIFLIHLYSKFQKNEDVEKYFKKYYYNSNEYYGIDSFSTENYRNENVYIITKIIIECNNIELIVYVLDNNIVVNINDLLIEICRCNQINFAKYLIQNGADIRVKDNLILKFAIINNNIGVIHLLLENNLIIDNNHFYIAVKSGNFKIVQLLLPLLPIISNYRDVLVYSASEGYLDIVKLLVDYGLNNYIGKKFEHHFYDKIYVYDIWNYFYTALEYASENGRLNVMQYLIDNCVNIYDSNHEGSENLNNIDYLLIRMCLPGGYARLKNYEDTKLEIIKLLIKNGANIHVNDDEALEWVSGGFLTYKIVEYLVENGANINANNGKALKNAIEAEKYKIVKYLVNNGAHITDSTIFWAKRNRKSDNKIIQFLKNRARVRKMKNYVTSLFS